MKSKIEKFSRDAIINMAAFLLCTGVLQLVVYPFLGRYLTEENYGKTLTLIGIVNILFSVIGNTLNNTRLIRNGKYSEFDKKGNYNVLILSGALLGGAVWLFLGTQIYHTDIITIIALTFLTIIGIVRAYFLVDYRLRLDFIRQFKANLILSVGYIFALPLIFIGNHWFFPFLIGESLSLIYIYKTALVAQEKFSINHDIRKIAKSWGQLALISYIGNVAVYFDRFLIYPLLGGSAVAIYTVAMFYGKTVNALAEPLANLLLGYLSQDGVRITTRRYTILFLLGAIPAIFFALLGIPIGPLATKLLYPNIFFAAYPYIFMASGAVLINVLISMTMPLILICCPQKGILNIQIIHMIIYGTLAIVLTRKYDLMGFCWASLIANTIKVCLTFTYGLICAKIRENRNKEKEAL